MKWGFKSRVETLTHFFFIQISYFIKKQTTLPTSISWINNETSTVVPIQTFIQAFLLNTKFFFYFFYAKTNKKLYKFSKYKLPKYTIKYFYIKPKNRLCKLFFIIRKAFLLVQRPKLSFKASLYHYYRTIFYRPLKWPGLALIYKTHRYIFKYQRKRLFYNNKSI